MPTATLSGTGREVRDTATSWPNADLQLRVAESRNGMRFSGYAAVFNVDSDAPIPGYGVERIAPGAFEESLSRAASGSQDIRMFLNHNSDVLLASTRNRTLRLSEDFHGLRVDADLPDTTAGRDLATLLKRGDVYSMSFGFSPQKSEPRRDGVNGTIHTRVGLWEVSPITSWAAYGATSADVRSLRTSRRGRGNPSLRAALALMEWGGVGELSREQRHLLHTLAPGAMERHITAEGHRKQLDIARRKLLHLTRRARTAAEFGARVNRHQRELEDAAARLRRLGARV